MMKQPCSVSFRCCCMANLDVVCLAVGHDVVCLAVDIDVVCPAVDLDEDLSGFYEPMQAEPTGGGY